MSQVAAHIFICFSSKDEAIAREVVEFLESQDIKCWISLRDVPAGQNYQENIVQAIERGRGIVFLFSAHSNESAEIKKELSIGGSLNMPVFPIRLAPITPTGALRYELATRQWIDVFPLRRDALARLADAIKRAFGATPEGTIPSPAAPHASDTANKTASRRRRPPASPAKKRAVETHDPIVAAGTQEFEAIRELLARHIGPIARVFVERAATATRTPDEFCERLATHVAEPSDRTSFLRAVRARLALKS